MKLFKSLKSTIFTVIIVGESVVQAAVYGPSEIKLSKELYDKAVIEVSYKPKIGVSGMIFHWHINKYNVHF